MQRRKPSIPLRTAATSLALITALLTFAPPLAARANEDTDPSAVTVASAAARKRPLVIRRPGSYSLPLDLRVDGDVAIEIVSNDVTLDLGGYSVLGPGGRQGVAISIVGVSNVEVTNGKVRDYGIGVRVVNSTNVSISHLQIDGQDSGGAPPDIEIGVLILDSRGVVVRDNVVTDTFLGLFVRGEGSAGNHLVDNVITGGVNGELAICYNPAPGSSSGGPSGDVISRNVVSRFRRAFSFSTDSVGNVLRGNSFAFFDLGIVEATPGSNVIADNDELQISP